MDDYITREAAIEWAKHAYAKGLNPSLYIEEIPAADVEPVRHVCRNVWGEYEYYGEWMRCPSCRFNFNTVFAKFCGGCGAKMDLEDAK